MLKTLIFSIVSLFALSAFAEAKIAVVDLQRAIQGTKAGKKAKDSLEKEFKAKEKQLQKKEAELKKMSDDLQKKASLLSQDALRKQQEEFQKEMIKFRQEVNKSQQEIANKEREMTAPILKKMQKVIEDLGKENQYSLILEVRENGVLFAQKSVDITDEVIQKYEK